MPENTRWNKKIFALLLVEAKGVRSWRQFASDCDVSYVQLRKLALGTQENPPRPKLIRKVAKHAFGEIDLEDLMFAAGIHTGEGMLLRGNGKTADSAYAKYRLLSVRDRKMAERYIDFLLSEAGNSEEKHQGD